MVERYLSAVPAEALGLISHELRTPLVTILGFAELLEDDPKTESDRLYCAGRIRAAGQALRKVVDDLILFGMLSTAQASIVRRTVSLPVFWTQISARCDGLMRPGVFLDWQQGVPDVRLETDAEKLMHVLWHVVANAVKFTERGAVQITARVRDGSLRVRVHDPGVGIRADQHEEIFQPFWQADSSLARQHGGLGLGLYLARQVLVQLDGQIEVESCPGRGSRFTLTIPLGGGDLRVPTADGAAAST